MVELKHDTKRDIQQDAAIPLRLPLDESDARGLRVGDAVRLSGRLVTGRDAAHTWLLEEFRDEVAPYLEGIPRCRVGLLAGAVSFSRQQPGRCRRPVCGPVFRGA